MGSKRSIPATAYKLRPTYVRMRKDSHYRGPGIHDEQLQVQRNAPRSLAKRRQLGYVPEPAEAS